MNSRPPILAGRLTRSHEPPGFTLVVTLSLLVLLTLIALGMLGLSSVTLRHSSAHGVQSIARANARMALMLAIGELQKTSGPDQRVTLTSSLQAGAEPANPHWTGVTNVSPSSLTADPKSSAIQWLISGHLPNPNRTLTLSTAAAQGDALKLGSYFSAPNTNRDLLAPAVAITQGNNRGRYAWWIADEGTKARVDVARPKATAASDRERLTQSQSPLENGWITLGNNWSAFEPDAALDKTSLVSLPTVSLAAANPSLEREYFADVTTGGLGLPVNVVTGGMKADLSLIFDRSQLSKRFGERYFGATPSALTWNGAPIYSFTTSTPSKFYLSDAISRNGSLPTGPNWGNLWNFAMLWQNVSGQQIPLVGGHPLVESDLRYKTWLPYTNHNQGNFRRDVQQTNSPVAPVLSMFQIGFRLNSELAPPSTPPSATQLYRAQVGIQPVVGLWNPYNISIRATSYRFDWALYPYLRFNYARPTGNGTFTDGRLTKLWLREEWTSGAAVIPTPGDGSAGRWLQLETPAIDLQPGEFRLFSVLDRISVRAGQTYTLKPGWSEKGAFIVDLKDDAGNTRLVPKGYRAWFGDIVLQDTQSNEVRSKFPSLDLSSVSSTWFTLKSGNNILLRSTELWNGGSDPSISTALRVPEPVVSGSNGGLNTSKATYLIEDLAGDTVTPNIATWSFFSRTTNQIEAPDANQRLRGWIDANPRALVTNSVWDGSRVSSTGERSGWHTTTPFIGAWNSPGRPRVVGDGLGGNRGLLAEGGSNITEPEVNRAGGRYQGFGGASNTLAGGKTNVIIYDVPRSPLVSIGQFQHAQLSRYNFEPGFVVGNSYANPRIPLRSTSNPNFNGIGGLNVTDVSFDMNRKLWDSYFFSTMAPDYVNGSGTSWDRFFDGKQLQAGTKTLPNPRMIFAPDRGDTTIDNILTTSGDRAPEAIATRIMIKGAFNINSTSKNAWKTVLASMGASQLPVIHPQTGVVTWQNPASARFHRFGHVLTSQAYARGASGDGDAFWQGWRRPSDAEIEQLAQEIANEVKARGPFRSLAEFVNRHPQSSTVAHQQKGALQAALDRTLNANLPASVGKMATQPPGSQFSNATSNENTAVGSAAYVLQGDVLQSLAPILQARSDYFKIRACGEALDNNGNVIARAWCEGMVQRYANYIDSRDASFRTPAEFTSPTNRAFGRRYQMIAFRWLNQSEI
jgi:hypothetical protein